MNEKFKKQLEANIEIYGILYKDEVLDLMINEINEFLNKLIFSRYLIETSPKNHNELINEFTFLLESEVEFIIPYIEEKIIKIRQPGFFTLKEYCDQTHEFVKIYKKYLKHKIKILKKMKVDDKYGKITMGKTLL